MSRATVKTRPPSRPETAPSPPPKPSPPVPELRSAALGEMLQHEQDVATAERQAELRRLGPLSGAD